MAEIWDDFDVQSALLKSRREVIEFDPKSLDPIQIAADFYLLEGLSSGSFFSQLPRPDVDENRLVQLGKILGLDNPVGVHRSLGHPGEGMKQAKKLQDELLKRAAPAFRCYSHYSIGRELRYNSHMAMAGGPMSKIKDVTLTSSRGQAAAVWSVLFEEYGVAALETAQRLFSTMHQSLLGGQLWAECTEALIEYETGQISPKLFLDRVFNLEHNTGAFLNKKEWGNARHNRQRETWIIIGIAPDEFSVSNQPGLPRLGDVLNCHSADVPNIMGLYSCASETVRKLAVSSLGTRPDAKIKGRWDPVLVRSSLPTSEVVHLQEILDAGLPMKVSIRVTEIQRSDGTLTEVDLVSRSSVRSFIGRTWALKTFCSRAGYKDALPATVKFSIESGSLVTNEIVIRNPKSYTLKGEVVEQALLNLPRNQLPTGA